MRQPRKHRVRARTGRAGPQTFCRVFRDRKIKPELAAPRQRVIDLPSQCAFRFPRQKGLQILQTPQRDDGPVLAGANRATQREGQFRSAQRFGWDIENLGGTDPAT